MENQIQIDTSQSPPPGGPPKSGPFKPKTRHAPQILPAPRGVAKRPSAGCRPGWAAADSPPPPSTQRSPPRTARRAPGPVSPSCVARSGLALVRNTYATMGRGTTSGPIRACARRRLFRRGSVSVGHLSWEAAPGGLSGRVFSRLAR